MNDNPRPLSETDEERRQKDKDLDELLARAKRESEEVGDLLRRLEETSRSKPPRPSWVWVHSYQGNNMSLLTLFSQRLGPRMYVRCGYCKGGFSGRITMVDYPVLVCPCGMPNKLPLKMSWA